MTPIVVYVNSSRIDLDCVRVIAQNVAYPGGHRFSLEIAKPSGDELLETATSAEEVAQSLSRSLLERLAFACSRLSTPGNCGAAVWVLNSIDKIRATTESLQVEGECSRWVQLGENENPKRC